jgi:hypothetical protein
LYGQVGRQYSMGGVLQRLSGERQDRQLELMPTTAAVHLSSLSSGY